MSMVISEGVTQYLANLLTAEHLQNPNLETFLFKASALTLVRDAQMSGTDYSPIEQSHQ